MINNLYIVNLFTIKLLKVDECKNNIYSDY